MPNGSLERLASLDAEQLDRLAALAKQLEDADHADALAAVGRKHRDRSVTRRGLLQAGGAVGAGALLGGAATGAASADASTSDDDFDIGQPDNRGDVFADGVDADSVSTGEASIGKTPTRRPIVSNGDRTIYVDPNNGSDTASGSETDPVATIQEAVDRVPLILRHQYTIDLTTAPSLPVTYDEDVLIDSTLGTGQAYTAGVGSRTPVEGPVVNLVIDGDRGTPSDVQVRSLTASSCVGVASPRVSGIEFTGVSPYYEGNYAAEFYGGGEYQVWGCSFTSGVDSGVRFYASTGSVKETDLSNCDVGITGKRGANVQANSCTGSPNLAYEARSASVLTYYGDSTTPGSLLKTVDSRIKEGNTEVVDAVRDWNTISFSSGQTRTGVTVISGYSTHSAFGKPIDVIATPANDPGNDHGYEVTKTWYNTANDDLLCEVTETENAGGGEARILAYPVGSIKR